MMKHIPWKQISASWVGLMRLVEVLAEVLQAILQVGSARWHERLMADRQRPMVAVVGAAFSGTGLALGLVEVFG